MDKTISPQEFNKLILQSLIYDLENNQEVVESMSETEISQYINLAKLNIQKAQALLVSKANYGHLYDRPLDISKEIDFHLKDMDKGFDLDAICNDGLHLSKDLIYVKKENPKVIINKREFKGELTDYVEIPMTRLADQRSDDSNRLCLFNGVFIVTSTENDFEIGNPLIEFAIDYDSKQFVYNDDAERFEEVK